LVICLVGTSIFAMIILLSLGSNSLGQRVRVFIDLFLLPKCCIDKVAEMQYTKHDWGSQVAILCSDRGGE
jgi:hypothetical protein